METHKYAPREIAYGSFAPATKLPEGVDTDNI
jgi:HSP20 family molecular chaperone IbpA